ncbi:hypothetical protein ABZS71_33640 [Streptomyces sp. NPDC005393]|uniref:hypothetical protein n=1 Tax=Streptomyces sp. NPDC005393 TaxID=3157041 RepID=UPI0033B48568
MDKVFGKRTLFQVPVADIAHLTGLNLGPLPSADRLPIGVRTARQWTLLESYDDITVHAS